MTKTEAKYKWEKPRKYKSWERKTQWKGQERQLHISILIIHAKLQLFSNFIESEFILHSVQPSYLITPWSRVLLEKIIGFQLVKKFSTFYGIRRFINAFTCPYPEPPRSRPYPHNLLPADPS
jgi:hypothetical protein